jgi:hypothetical protein
MQATSSIWLRPASGQAVRALFSHIARASEPTDPTAVRQVAHEAHDVAVHECFIGSPLQKTPHPSQSPDSAGRRRACAFTAVRSVKWCCRQALPTLNLPVPILFDH